MHLSLMIGVIMNFAGWIHCSNEPDQVLQIQRDAKNPWTHLDFKNDSADIRFAIVSDRTGVPRAGVFASALRKVGYLRPEFVMCVGDLVEGYTLEGIITDLGRIENDWDYITGLTDSLEMPFFYVVGNNDINSPAATPLWERRFGRTYYKFIYKNVLFVSLNSDDPPGSRDGKISDTQIRWLNETLKRHSGVRWTCIFLHRPLWRYDETRAIWDQVERVLGDRPRTVFSGHRTEYNRMQVNGFTYFTLASTGSGDAPEPPPSPVFDHIVWVTITADGPLVANLMLDGIWGDDPPTEAKSN